MIFAIMKHRDSVLFENIFMNQILRGGIVEVIMNVSADSPEYQRAVKMWGDLVKTSVSGDSVSVNLVASLKLAVPKMIPQAEVINQTYVQKS